MFDPKKEVPSLELCKKLKDLGYPQDGGGWYWHRRNGKWELSFEERAICKNEEARIWSYTAHDFSIIAIKAPTIAEMWEWLPFIVNGGDDIDDLRSKYGFLNVRKYENNLSIISWLNMHNKCHERIPQFCGTSLPNNMAEALIWLAENGYIDFRKEVQDV